MIQQGLVAEAVALGSSLQSLSEKCRAMGAQQIPNGADRVVRADGEIMDRNGMGWNIATSKRCCEKWLLQASMMQAFTLELWVRNGRGGTFLELAGRLDSLRVSIMDEAVFRFFLAIPVDLSVYVNQERPFGDGVWNAFPSSRDDLREAGNCIACSRNSAAVYHAMCALEPAMKALARNVRAPWSPTKSTWHAALLKIEKRIGEIASGPKTRGQPDRVVFLSQAASEFRYFKDGWRNATMHARYKASDKPDAERVLTHVKTFMVLLSSRLRERGSPRQ
jgi:hypothetical protein